MPELDWLTASYFGNPLELWVVSAVILVLGSAVVLLTRGVLVSRLAKLAKRSSSSADDVAVGMIRDIHTVVVVAAALYFSTRILVLPDQFHTVVRFALTVAIAYQVATWGAVLIDVWLRHTFARGEASTQQGIGYGAVRFVARLVLWTFVALLALDNLGVEVTALVAGLGVGGIAVALAVQNILGDIFNSLSIVLDQPFEVGDFIIVGDLMGVVENIGVKTTRMRSLSGEQLVFSNSDLVGSRIRNFKRMRDRRVVFEIGVTYETPIEQIEQIPAAIRKIVESQENVRFDRSHFARYGDFALIFETVYYVESPEFNVYMDRHQAINLGIMRELQARKVGFAYPTQTLYVQAIDGVDARSASGDARQTKSG